MSTLPAPDVDAALVLGMASTALPFAGSREEEAERWLRILRLHGEAGAALQALGVSEAPLEGAGDATAERGGGASGDPVAEVGIIAAKVAERREASTVGSEDVLVAVMDVYGDDFQRVLQVHGTDRAEVLERLGMSLPEQPNP
jgi:hypothetical protein